VVPLLNGGVDDTGASDLGKDVIRDHPLADLSDAHGLNSRGFRQVLVTGISDDETTGSGGSCAGLDDVSTLTEVSIT